MVTEYFEKVEMKGRGAADINIEKAEIGMPEHLTRTLYKSPRGGDQPPRGGGPDVIPRPKMYPSILTARRPHYPDPSPNRRVGRMPIGTDTRNPWGRADGGLMDIPLPGRKRDI